MTNPVQSGDLGSFSQAKIPTEKTDKPVVAVLLAAADLLEKPGAWTQGAIGRLEDGSPVYDASPESLSRATCYCMAGAMWVANGYVYPEEAFEALPDGPRHGTGSWNDAPGRTQAEVVGTLRAAADAIAKATGETQ